MALQGMGMAGYTWRVARLPPFLAPRKDNMRPVGPGIGVSSVQEFTFEAVGAGSGPLVLVYQQAGAPQPEETLEIAVHATK